MKKFFPILLVAFVSLFIFSCKDDDTDYDTYSQARDVSGSFTSANNYGFTVPIGIESTDVVLVYRRDVENGNAWQLIPKTYFLSGGRELDYNALFNSQTVEIYIDPSFDLSTMTAAEASTYLNNQVFRVVLVPASAGKGTTSVDTSDYNAVVKYYNIDESKIKTYKLN
ncbi:hypothetical protein SAMN05443633_102112 [Chryseobacterium arachidis]|uniref:DUF1735 domain-containing protein n=1 Tax=Chryseobacterium arachidis TaxID=1416778 RepID=A0A1M4WQR8_9FLAO|nr:hypothetical protein [Chryseobacterium arachidis]SHE83641.1 hypothetical protein SAMN05443633_102112 [Chryseobacterium arachidis]